MSLNICSFKGLRLCQQGCSWGELWKWPWLKIIEYAVPSLALNYPCKKYQIVYESVYSYLCTCIRNKCSCKSEFVCNVHIQVMLKVVSFSVINVHGLNETQLREKHSFLNSQTYSLMYTFIDQMNWQFVQTLMDSKFQVRQNTSLFFVQGKSGLVLFHGFLFFCFMSSVSGTQNKCPNSHHSHPLHPFITWIWRECKVQNGLIL